MLYNAWIPRPSDASPTDDEVRARATAIVDQHARGRTAVPGIGHPIHKPVDPRPVKLLSIARETGFHGDEG